VYNRKDEKYSDDEKQYKTTRFDLGVEPHGDFQRTTYPLYTALVIGLTRERFVALGLPS